MRREKEIEERLALLRKISREKYGTDILVEIPEEGLRNAIHELLWVLDLIG